MGCEKESLTEHHKEGRNNTNNNNANEIIHKWSDVQGNCLSSQPPACLNGTPFFQATSPSDIRGMTPVRYQIPHWLVLFSYPGCGSFQLFVKINPFLAKPKTLILSIWSVGLSVKAILAPRSKSY